MNHLPLAWCLVFLVRSSSSSSSSHILYEFRLSRKISFKGLGNQFWDKDAGSSIYRVAEAFEKPLGHKLDSAKPILAPFSHAAALHGGGTPWTMLFDLSGINVLTSLNHRTYFSTNCTNAKLRLEAHQMPSDQGVCEEKTPDAACQLLESQGIAWVDESSLGCKIPIPRKGARTHDHAFLSPFFFDPVKQRQDEFDRSEVLPFKHESAILNPSLGMALRKLRFSHLIRKVADDIMKAVGCGLDCFGAVHYHLFEKSCSDCRTCRFHCAPTNDDLDFLKDNFTNSSVSVVWVATDDPEVHSLVIDDPPSSSSSSQSAPLALVSQSSQFVADIIERHLHTYVGANHRGLLMSAIDLFFLTNADQAIVDLYSTFSAIAMRKREAMEKRFMVW